MHPYLWREVIYLQTHQCPYIKGVAYLKGTGAENWIKVKGIQFLKNLSMTPFPHFFLLYRETDLQQATIEKINKKHQIQTLKIC